MGMCIHLCMQSFPIGKLNRGLSVVDTIRILKGDAVTDDDIFKASVLGWLVEFVSTETDAGVGNATYLINDTMVPLLLCVAPSRLPCI